MNNSHIDKLAVIEVVNEILSILHLESYAPSVELWINVKITDKDVIDVAQTIKKWVKKYEL